MKNNTIKRVIVALQELGDATVSEMSDYLDISLDAANTSLRCLNKTNPRSGKRAYVKSWRRVQTLNGLRYFKAFALGDKQDKTKPKRMKSAVRERRYIEKLKLRTMNSIFALGLGVRQRKAIVAATRVSTD